MDNTYWFHSVADSLAISYDGGVIYEPTSNKTIVKVKIEHEKGFSTGNLILVRFSHSVQSSSLFLSRWSGWNDPTLPLWHDFLGGRRHMVPVQKQCRYFLRHVGVNQTYTFTFFGIPGSGL